MNIKQHIDDGGEVMTRDGREVRIYATDGGEVYPIHGSVGGWIRSWKIEGTQLTNGAEYDDLIPKRPKLKD
jgi:hypothetical protein